MNISIIGGSGFLGQRLSKRLDNSNIKYRSFDKKLLKNSKNLIEIGTSVKISIVKLCRNV